MGFLAEIHLSLQCASHSHFAKGGVMVCALDGIHPLPPPTHTRAPLLLLVFREMDGKKAPPASVTQADMDACPNAEIVGMFKEISDYYFQTPGVDQSAITN